MNNKYKSVVKRLFSQNVFPYIWQSIHHTKKYFQHKLQILVRPLFYVMHQFLIDLTIVKKLEKVWFQPEIQVLWDVTLCCW